jgi:L-seryl-tRNA(Ser) seleniumtransferase
MIKPLEISATRLAAELRQGEPPVLTRIQGEAVLLDLRTVLPGEEVDIVRAVARALG